MKILVTGGAGYIGSVLVKLLIEKHHDVIVYDNLSSGHEKSINSSAVFVKADLSDSEKLERIFSSQQIEAVFHFGGVISMAESMENPGKYFMENTSNTVKLLDVMRKHVTPYIIFSSTAGVYGNPIKIPIPEDHEKNPTNPYGESKLMIERILRWYDICFGIKSVVLRYFNASGATADGKLGELHKDETHLIPLAIKAALSKTPFKLYGTDYPTPDGTCVRDYIHVEDLCQAHILALSYLHDKNTSTCYNVGTGKGYSNKEIIREIEQITGEKISIQYENRRSGDTSTLIADSSKIKKELNWTPTLSDLPTIIQSAWNFHKQHNV